MKSKRQHYKCLTCTWTIGTHKIYDGMRCPDCKGPIVPILIDRRPLSDIEVEYILNVAHALSRTERVGIDTGVEGGRHIRLSDEIATDISVRLRGIVIANGT